MGNGNGAIVTRAELAAYIKGIDEKFQTVSEDIREIKDTLRRIDPRMRALENREAGRSALSDWQRWFVGAVCVGLVGSLATLVWLATS